MPELVPIPRNDRRLAELRRLAKIHQDYGVVSDTEVDRAAAYLGITRRHVRRLLKRHLTHDSVLREVYTLSDEVMTMLFLYRGNVAAARRAILATGEDMPPLRTLQAAVKSQVPTPIKHYMKHGLRGFRSGAVYLQGSPSFRGHTYMLDATDLGIDVTVSKSGRGKHRVRAWLVAVIDYHTRLIVGWTYCLGRPTANDVRSALVAAMRTRRIAFDDEPDGIEVGGIPCRALWDNGKEFLATNVTLLCSELGFHGYAVAPYSPHLKAVVEVFFRGHKALLLGLPGNSRGPLHLNGKAEYAAADDELLTEPELRQEIQIAIDAYNRTPHSAHKMSPLEAWFSDPYPVAGLEDEALYAHMMNHETRTVGTYGIMLNYVYYIAPNLGKIREAQVQVRYLPGDSSFIEVFHDGKWYCTAYPQMSLSDPEQETVLRDRKKLQTDSVRLQASAMRARSRSRVGPSTQYGTDSFDDNDGGEILDALMAKKEGRQPPAGEPTYQLSMAF